MLKFLCLLGLGGLIGVSSALADETRNAISASIQAIDAFEESATQNFRLLHQTTEEEAQAHLECFERVQTRFFASFETRKFELNHIHQPMVCVLFKERQSFDDYARTRDKVDMSWSHGYYSTRSNVTVLSQPSFDIQIVDSQSMGTDDDGREVFAVAAKKGNVPMAVRTHEIGHQLAFNSGLQQRGVQYPFWVTEGLAMSFEQYSEEEAGVPDAVNLVRLQSYFAARDNGRTVTLEDLVLMGRLDARDPQEIEMYYSHSWALFHFLYKEYPQQLHEYLKLLKKDGLGRRTTGQFRQSFLAAFGDIAEIEKQWLAYFQQHKRLVENDEQILLVARHP